MSNISRRNRDFINLCRLRARHYEASGCPQNYERIVIDVLSAPAPCYYVDPYRANAVLLPALSGKKGLRKAKYASSKVYNDMLRDLRLLRKAHPDTDIHELVLNLCAGRMGSPRFYMSMRRGLEIIRPLISHSL